MQKVSDPTGSAGVADSQMPAKTPICKPNFQSRRRLMMRCAGLSHWLDTPTDESQKRTPTTELQLPAYGRHVLMQQQIPKADLLSPILCIFN
jgi:hypothetical protein